MKVTVSFFVSFNSSHRIAFFPKFLRMLIFRIAFVVNFTQPCLHAWKNVSSGRYEKSSKPVTIVFDARFSIVSL